MEDDRNKMMYLIELCKDLDQYEEMKKHLLEYLKTLPKKILNSKLRKHISTAYLNCITKKLTTMRIIDSHENKLYGQMTRIEIDEKIQELESNEVDKEEEKYYYKRNLNNFKILKEKELTDFVEKIIENEIEFFISTFQEDVLDQIFFYKMKADYMRYIHDYVKNESILNKYTIDDIEKTYNIAIKLGEENRINESNLTFLLLKLNYTVFLHSLKNREDEAIKICKNTFQIAKKLLEEENSIETNNNLDEKDIRLTINLLKDNYNLWCLQKQTPTTNENNY